MLSGGGLALVLYALSEGPFKGWRSPVVLGAAAAGIVAFALLAWVELRQPHPMLALRLLADRMFRNANLASLLSYASFAGVLFIMPLFLQDLRGLTALQSGLTTFKVVSPDWSAVRPRRSWRKSGMMNSTPAKLE